MNIILDSSSSINLRNGGLIAIVLGLSRTNFAYFLGTIVRGECGDLTTFLDEMIDTRVITLLHGKSISPAKFAQLLDAYSLGLGETECIVQAEINGLTVCTDDGAARRACERHLGKGRVMGSARLIRECVCAGLLCAKDAYAGYELARSRGAFLPDVAQSYFEC